tara:strand:+ start:112 stop:405 length:294 start_codon:yes stop_codon:yes gene_type:complete
MDGMKKINLQEVKDFIRGASKEDINQISDQLNDIIKERRENTKLQFSVGDIVRIIHTRCDSNKEFIIVKINRKNIKVTGKDNLYENYTVSPNFLEKV